MLTFPTLLNKVDLRKYNNSLTSAIGDSDLVGKTLVVTESVTCGDITVPDTISLEIVNGGSISVNVGATLSINGSFDSYLGDVFTGLGNVVINGVTKTHSVNTIAELRNYTGYTNATIQVKGYYESGDGGGGPVRVWKDSGVAGTYVDNGGSIIVPTGGDGSSAWLWEHSGPVNVKWFGAKGDGVTDDTVSVQSTFTYSNNIFIDSGYYVVNDEIELEWNTKLNCHSDSLLDFSQGTAIECVKTKDVNITFLPNLSTTVSAGDRHIYFSSAHGLNQGDLIVFYDPADYSWSLSRDYYCKGERAKVGLVVSDTEVMLETNLLDGYSAGTLTQIGVHDVLPKYDIRGLNIKGRSSAIDATYGLVLNKAVDSIVSNVVIKEAGYTGCSIRECFNVSVIDSSFEENMTNEFGGDYGLAIANSQNISVRGCYSAGSRHGISVGGSSGFGKGVNYHLLISDCVIGTVGGSHAADMHSNTAYSGYENCIINGTVDFGGHCNYIRGCTIIEGNTEESNDIAIFAICEPSVNHIIENNNIVSSKVRTNPNANPIISIRPHEYTIKGGSFVVKNNTIEWSQPNPTINAVAIIGTTSMNLTNFSSSEKLFVLVEGNTFYSKNYSAYSGSFVTFRCSSTGLRGISVLTIKNNIVETTRQFVTLSSSNSSVKVAEEVYIENNRIKNTSSTGMVLSELGHLVIVNNSFIDYLKTATGSSSTNSAVFVLNTTTTVEHGNVTYSSYGNDVRRMYFGTITNLYRGPKANIGGQIDVISNVTNDVTM